MDIVIPGNEVFKRKHEGHVPTMGGEDVEWRFRGIYGCLEMQNKRRMGKMIADLATHLNPLDLNEIFFHAEKKGGPAKPQQHIDSFREAFTDADLYDLGFKGYPFTVQHEEVIVEERLDRFGASTEWSLLFSEAQVTHVNSYISDHLPFLLKCYPTSLNGQRHGKKFKFENMWVIDPSCREIIAKAWGDVSKTDAVDNMLNKNSFGHVGREISKLEDSLKYLTDAKSRHEVLNKIKEWRHKEEIMWWQGARTNFLKFEDSNTRWFHSRASMRQTTNVISKLQDANGVVYTDPDKLEHIVPITLRPVHERVCKVRELIDADRGWWREDLVGELFLPWTHSEHPTEQLDATGQADLALYEQWTIFGTVSVPFEDDVKVPASGNQFIFKKAGHNPSVLSKRVSNLVLSYRKMKASSEQPKLTFPTSWRPPPMGILKLNFDGGNVGEDS
ncbi:LOW QUALITY PROTEIN: hypothetical protein Cgig2_015810 [Carnegiea gigantea]|uniref:Uncharacterized protein n=1 Tax=Carnegiea gigantea TaxID=171969 RepID=A0A9Q1KH04_9CARY|nr:LOW QUALITY PROTEIN: hypothetical protein Cgig2_015810 [Carnegiea gigantea]